MKFRVKIGGVDYTKYVQIPFQTKMLRDESLDMASLRLYYTDRIDEFEPFTLVEISIEDDQKQEYKLYIASDVAFNWKS